VLLADLGNDEVTKWVEAELSGYKAKEIPKYREYCGSVFGTIQYYSMGNLIQQKMAIPIKIEHLDETHISIKDNITAIEEYSKKTDADNVMNMPIDLRVVRDIADINESCQIVSAGVIIPRSVFTEIVNSVKQRVLDILMALENKYGVLDDYYIEFGSKTDKAKITKTIINILNLNVGDQIKIGDGNKIDKSVIGRENEN
jgi:hypothetical protein